VWQWIADSYPAQSVNLRAVADGNFVVIDCTNGAQKIIAEVDFSAAAMTLYEGAIYLVQSAPYQVEKLDWTGRKAFVKQTKADYYTDAIDYTKLKTLSEFDQAPSHEGCVSWGEVHVIRRVPGYKKIRYYSHENIGYGPIQLPDHELHTTSVSWTLTAQSLDAAFANRFQALDGFLGAAYALHTAATLSAMAESFDLGKSVGNADASWAYAAHASSRGQLRSDQSPEAGAQIALILGPNFSPSVHLYDQYPGGMGLSEPLFAQAAHLVQAASALIQRCDCVHGCPACVGPILASEETGTQPISAKVAAQTVLRLLGAI
jgi:DEAD/DEAH box helicase domain-containing protein